MESKCSKKRPAEELYMGLDLSTQQVHRATWDTADSSCIHYATCKPERHFYVLAIVKHLSFLHTLETKVSPISEVPLFQRCLLCTSPCSWDIRDAPFQGAHISTRLWYSICMFLLLGVVKCIHLDICMINVGKVF